MKVLRRIGAIFLGLIVGLVILGFCLPSSYSVQRSITVKAKSEEVFPLINSLKAWPEWTVWNIQKFPDMKFTYYGPDTGVGAKSQWEGEKSGQGEMEITKSDPEKGIEYNLIFDKRFVSQGSVALDPAEGNVNIIWTNSGKLGNNPINRYFGLMMDSFMGPDFEQGLINLKKKIDASHEKETGK